MQLVLIIVFLLFPLMNSHFLKMTKSWELFSEKVFWGGTCLPELETLGRQLVKSCHGLPLAIVVLGGLLANKEKTNKHGQNMLVMSIHI